MATFQDRLGTGPLPPLSDPPVPVHATDDAIRRQFLLIRREVTELTKRALALPAPPPAHLRGNY